MNPSLRPCPPLSHTHTLTLLLLLLLLLSGIAASVARTCALRTRCSKAIPPRAIWPSRWRSPLATGTWGTPASPRGRRIFTRTCTWVCTQRPKGTRCSQENVSKFLETMDRSIRWAGAPPTPLRQAPPPKVSSGKFSNGEMNLAAMSCFGFHEVVTI